MSAIKLTYLYCDGGEECPRQDGEQSPFKVDPLPTEDATLQREQAAADGWTRRGKKDYCPECAERIRGATDRTNA